MSDFGGPCFERSMPTVITCCQSQLLIFPFYLMIPKSSELFLKCEQAGGVDQTSLFCPKQRFAVLHRHLTDANNSMTSSLHFS